MSVRCLVSFSILLYFSVYMYTLCIYIYGIKHRVDSLYIFKYLCVLNQTRDSFTFSVHSQSDSKFFLNESIRQAHHRPVVGFLRDEHEAFPLGNAFLYFKVSVRRKGAGFDPQQPAAMESHISSPRVHFKWLFALFEPPMYLPFLSQF